MASEKKTNTSQATEGGYLETRLRSFAVTRLHRDPKTGEVWTEPESQRDQDLLDAADEMERLRGREAKIRKLCASSGPDDYQVHRESILEILHDD